MSCIDTVLLCTLVLSLLQRRLVSTSNLMSTKPVMPVEGLKHYKALAALCHLEPYLCMPLPTQ